MKRVGTAIRIAQGMVIVRSPDPSAPAVGDEVVDETLDVVGRIVDVIGPVTRPFIVVDPTSGDQPTILNQRLYVR